MTAQKILDAWKAAQKSQDFQATFEQETGITPAQVQAHFRDWNNMGHADAQRIAQNHDMTVNEGGFQAYLADVIS